MLRLSWLRTSLSLLAICRLLIRDVKVFVHKSNVHFVHKSNVHWHHFSIARCYFIHHDCVDSCILNNFLSCCQSSYSVFVKIGRWYSVALAYPVVSSAFVHDWLSVSSTSKSFHWFPGESCCSTGNHSTAWLQQHTWICSCFHQCFLV